MSKNVLVVLNNTTNDAVVFTETELKELDVSYVVETVEAVSSYLYNLRYFNHGELTHELIEEQDNNEVQNLAFAYRGLRFLDNNHEPLVNIRMDLIEYNIEEGDLVYLFDIEADKDDLDELANTLCYLVDGYVADNMDTWIFHEENEKDDDFYYSYNGD